jgi:hypothetical protein
MIRRRTLADHFTLALLGTGCCPRCCLARTRSRVWSFRLPAAAELLFSCVAKRKVTKREGHPAWRLPGLLPGKSVSRGRAFRTGILPVRKGTDIPVGSRCAACRPRLTAAQGPRVEQRAILARTFQRSQSDGRRNSQRAGRSNGGSLRTDTANLCSEVQQVGSEGAAPAPAASPESAVPLAPPPHRPEAPPKYDCRWTNTP